MSDSEDIVSGEAADSLRDSVILRWAKFVSIVVVSALLMGGLFVISIHVVALYSATKFAMQEPYRNSTPIGASRHDIEVSRSDTPKAMQQRFYIGSVVGGAVGIFYVIRCLVRREDP
jgi:hypothetical protein